MLDMKLPDRTFSVRSIKVGAEEFLAAFLNVGPKAPPSDSVSDFAKLPKGDLLEQRYRDFKKLVMNEWAFPNGPEHDDKIVTAQMLQDSINERFDCLRFPLSRA